LGLTVRNAVPAGMEPPATTSQGPAFAPQDGGAHGVRMVSTAPSTASSWVQLPRWEVGPTHSDCFGPRAPHCPLPGDLPSHALPTACPRGWFGEACAQRCHCPPGASCHHITGECHCPPGFTGPGCEQGRCSPQLPPYGEGQLGVLLERLTIPEAGLH
jgi:hypothetical protein